MQENSKISVQKKEKRGQNSRNLTKFCKDSKKITIFASESGRNSVSFATAIISRLAKMPRKPLWNNARFNQ
jgi:hypothetical protein